MKKKADKQAKKTEYTASFEKSGIRYVKKKPLPKTFYQDLVDAENDFYSEPTVEGVEKIILHYKMGSEYYSTRDKKLAQTFSTEVQNILMNPITISLFKMKEKDNKIIDPNATGNDIKQKQMKRIMKKRTSISVQMEAEKIDQMDYYPEAKFIIDKSNESINNFLSLIKSAENKQKINFKRKLRRKAFRSQVSEEFNLGSLNLNAAPKELRDSMNSNSGERKRRITLSKESLLNRNILNTEGNAVEDNDNKDKKAKVTFTKKKGTTDELDTFLNDYNKRLCHLYQSNIEDATNKLNKIVDDNLKKRIERFDEFQGNLKDYLGMGDEFKDLIDELRGDYIKDIDELDKKQEEEIKNLLEKLSKSQIKDKLAINALNMETFAEIVNILK